MEAAAPPQRLVAKAVSSIRRITRHGELHHRRSPARHRRLPRTRDALSRHRRASARTSFALIDWVGILRWLVPAGQARCDGGRRRHRPRLCDRVRPRRAMVITTDLDDAGRSQGQRRARGRKAGRARHCCRQCHSEPRRQGRHPAQRRRLRTTARSSVTPRMTGIFIRPQRQIDASRSGIPAGDLSGGGGYHQHSSARACSKTNTLYRRLIAACALDCGGFLPHSAAICDHRTPSILAAPQRSAPEAGVCDRQDGAARHS